MRLCVCVLLVLTWSLEKIMYAMTERKRRMAITALVKTWNSSKRAELEAMQVPSWSSA